MKSSQTTQLYITYVCYKQPNIHHHIKQSFFVTNLIKINIFLFSSITWLIQDPTRRVWYFIFFILDDIQHQFSWSWHENKNCWLISFTRLNHDITQRVWYFISSFLMRHLKGLIFDCLSFAKCLITSSSTVDRKTFITSLWRPHAADCRGVLP